MAAVFEVLNIHSSRSLTCRSYQGEDFFCPFHLHPELEMVFIETGYVESFIGNQKQILKSGELQLIGANVPHSFKLDCDAKESLLSKYIHIEPSCLATLKHIAEFEFVEQLLIQFGLGAVYSLDQSMTQRYFSVFEKQGVERLLAILSLFIELLKQQPIRLASENYLLCDKSNQVMNFIMLNAADDLSLSQVAYQLNMSTSTLNRTLKKSLGMSYVEFVNHTRINLACDFLREGSETITQVALSSGFKSSSQFNKVFKQMLKISPREYRESYRDIVPQELKNQDEPIWDVGEHC